MLYLAVQTLFWLLLAFFFGVFIGWLFWGRSARGYRTELFSLRETLRDRESRAEKAGQQLLSTEKELNTCRQELNQLNSLRESLKSSEAKVTRLTGDLTAGQAELQRLQRENRGLEELRGNLAERDERIGNLNSKLSSCEEALSLYKTELAEACREVCGPENIEPLPAAVPVARAADADDLKEISGVGPFLEGKLNAFGIYTFKQVAALTPEVVKTLGATFGSFADRIGREGWIHQAKSLHAAKYGETL